MEIVRTTTVKMSQKEKEAFETVMNSLEEFCKKTRSLHEIDEEENDIFEYAAKALSYLDDFRACSFNW